MGMVYIGPFFHFLEFLENTLRSIMFQKKCWQLFRPYIFSPFNEFFFFRRCTLCIR